jgi:fatty-acyl-CoA synthase
VDSTAKAWVRALEATAPVERGRSSIFPIILEELAGRFTKEPALIGPARTLSYEELVGTAARYARWGLAQGFRPGDCLGLLMPNCPEYLAIWLGLTRLGVRVALLNTHLTGAALAHALGCAGVRSVIVSASLRARLAEAYTEDEMTPQRWVHGEGDTYLPRVDLAVQSQSPIPLSRAECAPPALTDRALCIYTSGTTGLPKAAHVSHYRVVQWTHWFAGLMHIRPADRMFNCLPMYHSIGGVVASGAPLVAGASVVLRERFSAREFWRDLAAERCTLFQYIGELCRYLVNSPPQAEESEHALRLCCGNGLRADVWQQFQTRFRIPQILEYYAATEGSFSLYNCEGRRGAVGRIPAFLAQRAQVELLRLDRGSGEPLRNAAGRCERCSTDESGEAVGRLSTDHGVAGGRFEGYTDAEASARKLLRDVFEPGDLWYRTGDLMRQDHDGYFYFVDRVGDTYRWKGENVSTQEVSAVVCSCAGVLDGAAFGVVVPHNEGRAGMAALVVDTRFDLEAFRAHLNARLPDYARPLFVRIVPALELTGTFRHRAGDLAIQAFDPQCSRDPLYFDDRGNGRYVPLDPALYASILAGTARL